MSAAPRRSSVQLREPAEVAPASARQPEDDTQVDRLVGATQRLATTIAATEALLQRRADLLKEQTTIAGPMRRLRDRQSRLVSLAEAARRTGRNPEVLRRWCIDGRIPAVRLGRAWAVSMETVAELAAHSARSRPRLPRAGA